MGDLHCPATLLLAAYGDAAQAQSLGERLRSRRVAHVWTSDVARARETSDEAASALGVQVSVREELGGGDQVRIRAVLEEVADTHRGETVLVVTDEEAVRLALALLVTRPTDTDLPDGGALVEVIADEHGWTRVG